MRRRRTDHFHRSTHRKQLQIDQWVGSLEEGKDADVVIWDGPPLSIYSQVEATWIEGIRYWSKGENKDLEIRAAQLRKALVQKILSSKAPTGGNEIKFKSLVLTRIDKLNR